ncbi:unnamed protein product [Lota lota]
MLTPRPPAASEVTRGVKRRALDRTAAIVYISTGSPPVYTTERSPAALLAEDCCGQTTQIQSPQRESLDQNSKVPEQNSESPDQTNESPHQNSESPEL